MQSCASRHALVCCDVWDRVRKKFRIFCVASTAYQHDSTAEVSLRQRGHLLLPCAFIVVAGGGRTRGRGHRNYFEGSLSLAASVAAELTNTCPVLGTNSSL